MAIGNLIDRLYQLKQDKAQLNKQLSKIDDEITEVSQQIMDEMDEQELPTVANKTARVTISEQTVYNPVDWDAIYLYIAETNQPFLLQRRLMNNALAELANQGVTVPGTEPVNLRKLSIRKV